ncbi:hypothetical protein INP57_17160 [Saccharopolyspora sp. HNM0986]|uniref:hypothetical protein n=1 Tax=Saccharopolyspora galaxeae TaxID=2781241 RepID=UPI00190CAC8F|nr:hypothetical protein [Saccharopolyspora sp. HNM0986]MBK0868545.1 hypothetical protein [Saccharopolyspora sp. HNM0986]
MLIRIAVVPYPPLLVPELTVRTGPRTEPVRGACLRATTSLTDSAAEWVAVGVDRRGPTVLEPDTAGTFAGYGVDVPVSLGGDRPAWDPELPLPALVAGWLRQQAGAERVTVRLLAADTPTEQAAELGRQLGSAAAEFGLLVLAEGTNRQDERSPHPPDPRARRLDERLRSAVRDVDRRELLDLDPQLCAELGVASRAAWQCAAGAAGTGNWAGRLVYSDTPHGVTYHVGTWSRAA